MRPYLSSLAVFTLAMCAGCTGPGLLERQSWIFGRDPPDDPALLAKLGPTPTQRIALVRSMRGKMGESADEAERVSRDLAQRIQAEDDPGVRVEIVRALAAHRTAIGTAVLRAGVTYPNADPSVDVRIEICDAWGKIGGPDGQKMLTAVLANDTDEDVRGSAARALGAFKDSGNMKALAAALEDTSIAVQHQAMQSMKAVSGKDYGDNAQAWREYAKTGTTTQEGPSIADRLWPWRF